MVIGFPSGLAAFDRVGLETARDRILRTPGRPSGARWPRQETHRLPVPPIGDARLPTWPYGAIVVAVNDKPLMHFSTEDAFAEFLEATRPTVVSGSSS